MLGVDCLLKKAASAEPSAPTKEKAGLQGRLGGVDLSVMAFLA